MEADLVILATNQEYHPLGLPLLWHPLFRRAPENFFVISASDTPSPLFQGLMASWPASDRACGLAQGWNYYHPGSAEPYISATPWRNPPLLWSFLGSTYTHPVRQRIAGLTDDRSYFLETGSVAQPHLRGETGHAVEDFRNHYINKLQESRFVLCPRGVGPSSMRIFETMKAGRVPVIISDEWLEPPYIDWASCSIRIPESEASAIPDILRAREPEAERMAAAAATAWEGVFGECALFHHAVEACLRIKHNLPSPFQRIQRRRFRLLLRAPHRTALLRYLKQTLTKSTSFSARGT